MRVLRLAPIAAIAVLAGCGSSHDGGLTGPKIQAAQTYKLVDFAPAAAVTPGRATTVSFVIQQPNGKPLTQFATGSGPHTGVHLIIVRSDLATIIHRHPPIKPDGTISQQVTFPSSGKWHVLVDVYPRITDTQRQVNFQLTSTIAVSGAFHRQAIGAFKPSVTVGGYRFTIHSPPKIKAIQAAFLNVTVAKPDGTKAQFEPWYGALAHAVFFQVGTLNYFHTHVCAANTAGCTSVLGGAKVTGASTTPGKLSVGVLIPVAGTWKLFLQCKIDGHILTAPYTIEVS